MKLFQIFFFIFSFFQFIYSSETHLKIDEQNQNQSKNTEWVEIETNDLKEGTKTIEQQKIREEFSKKKSTLELQKWVGNPLGLDIHGYLQNSYTSIPFHKADSSNRNFFLYPNRLPNSFQGNQYYLVVEKNNSDKLYDIGFRVDFLYGNDWEFTKSYGLFDNRFKSGSFNGYDIPQAYLDLRFQIFSKKISLLLGRFYNPGDYEGKMAIKRPLFSSSYMINSTPFSFLGALSTISWYTNFNFLFGVVNGSDRYWNSKYKPGIISGISYSIGNKLLIKSIQFVGPNQLPYFPGVNEQNLPITVRTSPEVQWLPNSGYSRNLRFYSSNVLSWKISNQWKISKELSLNYDENTPLTRNRYFSQNTHWKSVGAWLYYDFKGNQEFTIIKRVEMFSDYQGAVTKLAGRYLGLTLGMAWKPSERFWFRPELRYDRSLNDLAFQELSRSYRYSFAFDFFLFF